MQLFHVINDVNPFLLRLMLFFPPHVCTGLLQVWQNKISLRFNPLMILMINVSLREVISGSIRPQARKRDGGRNFKGGLL
jgi:hypothetical protein